MIKNNEKVRWLVKIAIALVIIAIGAAVAWGVLKERVNNNRDRIVKVEEKTDSNQKAVVEMKTDLKYILKTTDQILEKLE